MINDLLNYNLKIHQKKDSFKFSIDSVLLAEFVEINFKTKNIIDFCSGNAPIPLILSQKFDKNIVGVELQKEIYDLGIKSIAHNKIKNIDFLNMNVKNINEYFDYKFDIVTCNPPYFKYDKSAITSISHSKAVARHEIEITLEDVIKESSKVLRHGGSLYLVHRGDRMIEIIDMLKKYKFGLRRIQFVYDNRNSNSCFILIEAKYLGKDDLKILRPLYIDEYLEG